MATTINNIKVDFGLGATPPTVTFLQGCDMTISVIRETLRQIEESEEGRGAPGAVSSQGTGFGWIARSSGNFPFTTAESSALTIEIMPPFGMTFEAGAIPFQSAVGNLLGTFNESPGAIVQINNAVGATNVSASTLESGLFQGGVAIDINSPYVGPGYDSEGTPIGTRKAPTNSLTSGHEILDVNGFNTFFIIRTMEISGEDFESHAHKFIGDSAVGVVVTVLASANVSLCEFSEMIIQGVLDNGNVVRDCQVRDLTYFNGAMRGCLYDGTVTLDGNVDATIMNGSGTLTVNMGVSGQSLDMFNYSGEVTLTNKTGVSDTVDINMGGGEVIVDSSVTAGTIKVSGNGKLTHTQTGTEIVINELVNGADIANIHLLLELQNPHHSGVGKVWHWSPYDGDDTAAGDHKSTAVKTFAQAQALARDYSNDVVIFWANNPAGVTVTTENLVISKSYLQLIGAGRNCEINSANDSLDAVSITGVGVGISGFQVTTSATNTKWAIHSSNDFTLVKDVWVSDAVNGVHFENGEYGIADNVKMHHNLGIGLKFSGTSDHCDVLDCHIGSNGLDNVVVDLDVATHEVNLMGSTVIHSSVAGYGLNISSTSRSVIVHKSVTLFNNSLGDINDAGIATFIADEIHHDEIAEAILAKSKTLTVGKFLALK